MNPEYFDIENLKMFGMWPNGLMLSKGIVPYIKRKGTDLKINMIDDMKGENTFDILENCPNVKKVYLYNSITDENYEKALKSNLKGFPGNKINTRKLADDADFVCVHRSSCDPDKLKVYYDQLKSGGIFCGSDHDTDQVKVALTSFRRSNKIGTPIQISNRTIWFWIKG
jgi:hypothetical protein